MRIEGLTISAACALLGCAEGEGPPDTSDSLPALPVEVVEGEQLRIEDYEILGEVRQALWAQPQVGRRAVAIEVHRGIVTLSGAVTTAEAKRRALREAASIAGVQRVIDRIQVVEPPGGEPEPAAASGLAVPREPARSQ